MTTQDAIESIAKNLRVINLALPSTAEATERLAAYVKATTVTFTKRELPE